MRENKRRRLRADRRLLPVSWVQSTRVSLIVDLDPEGVRPPAYIAAEALNLELLHDPYEREVTALATYLAADRLTPKIKAQERRGVAMPSAERTTEMLYEIRRTESNEAALGLASLVTNGFRAGLSKDEIHALIGRSVPSLFELITGGGKVDEAWIERMLVGAKTK